MASIYILGGLALAEKRTFKEAIDNVQKAINLQPQNPVYYIFLGRIYIDQEKYDKALEVLTTAIEMDKTNQLAYAYQALAYLGKGEVEQGRFILEGKGVFSSPHFDARLLVWLESQLIKKEKSDGNSKLSPTPKPNEKKIDNSQDKEKLLKEGWIKRFLLWWKAKRRISAGLKKMGYEEYDKATKEFKQALALYPLIENIYSYLGEALFQNEEFQAATPYLSKASSQNPKNPSILSLLGKTYYKLGNFNQSEKWLKKADELDHMIPEIYYYLGLNCLQKGKVEKARFQFMKAIEKDFQLVTNRLKEAFKTA